MIPFSLIANLSMMGEWNFSVPLLSQSNFFGVWFWQLISVALAIGIGFIFLFGKKQRKNMREFMERRTETILDQKTKIEEQNSLLEVEHKKSDELLQDIFPKKIIKILKKFPFSDSRPLLNKFKYFYIFISFYRFIGIKKLYFIRH